MLLSFFHDIKKNLNFILECFIQSRFSSIGIEGRGLKKKRVGGHLKKSI